MRRTGLIAHAFVVAGAFVAACGTTAPDIVHRIVPHSVSGCPVAKATSASADASDENAPDLATVELRALGDFGDSTNTTEVFTGATTSGLSVGFPAALAGVEATIRSAGGTWTGVGLADTAGDVEFTMWPAGEACDAAGWDVSDWGVSENVQGLAFTAFASGTRVLVAGGQGMDGVFADAALFDVRTGQATNVASGMHAPRAWAAATPFGDDGVLVSGGAYEGGVRADAEVLNGDGERGQGTILLAQERAHHAAVVDATGRTLLIGGVDHNGALVKRLEAVDPKSLANVVTDLGQLTQGRIDPVAVRLTSGMIVVAGGLNGTVDGPKQPVAGIEWFNPDGSKPDGAPCPDPNLPATAGRTMVALADGGALVVDPGSSCDSTHPGRLWHITPDHCAYELDIDGPICNPRLVPASDGMPWLWDGQKWRRFNPWAVLSTQATTVGNAPLQAPDVAPTDGPDSTLPAPIAVDPGLFLWLARDPSLGVNLRGFRHDTRNEFTRDGALLVDGTEHTAPLGLPTPTDGPVLQSKGVLLGGGASVVVTDTTYADISIEVTLSAPANPGSGIAIPRVLLGDKFEVGGPACPWPTGAAAPDAGPDSVFSVTRTGGNVIASIDKATSACPGPAGRVTVGLGAPADGTATVVRTFTVKRLP